MIKTKQEAIVELKKGGLGPFVVEMLENLPRFNAKSAKLLKCMAAIREAGFEVGMAGYTLKPVISFNLTTWDWVEQVGEALRTGKITVSQVAGLIDKL